MNRYIIMTYICSGIFCVGNCMNIYHVRSSSLVYVGDVACFIELNGGPISPVIVVAKMNITFIDHVINQAPFPCQTKPLLSKCSTMFNTQLQQGYYLPWLPDHLIIGILELLELLELELCTQGFFMQSVSGKQLQIPLNAKGFDVGCYFCI